MFTTYTWNKPSNSIFKTIYDWPYFDRSPTGLCQTRSGVKWVDTQKPGGFLPALLSLPFPQSPLLNFHAPKDDFNPTGEPASRPLLVYILTPLPTRHAMKEINNLLLSILWDGKGDKTKRIIIINEARMLDLKSFNFVLKAT